MIQHCRKTLHSRAKENRFVIKIQKALWRKLEPLFSRNNLTFSKQNYRARSSVIQHCRKTLHSRAKENRFVIKIQKALWRKLEPLFNRNKKLHASKEFKENVLASEGKSCRPETITTVNRCVMSSQCEKCGYNPR